MKGIVFTELLDMVEQNFGAAIIDDVLDDCDLESGGAYTSVGTYDHTELLQIVAGLSQHTGLSARDLVQKYGHYLFFRFHEIMPVFFEGVHSVFDFLETVHGTIHVEVKKLYPDANLPHFDTERKGDDVLIMVYKSHCPLADFAEGLMQGCIEFFEEDITIRSKDHNTQDEFCRVFTLTKH
jgi:hypothetical protein